jgi:hypothetical protein
MDCACADARRLRQPRKCYPKEISKGSNHTCASWCCMASRAVTSGPAASSALARSSTASSSKATAGGGTALHGKQKVV